MNGSADNPDITKFLNRRKVGVLATASLPDGKPHAATVYFMPDENLNILFVTKGQTSKHKNLISNPRAYLVVTEESSQTTVQIFGDVEQVQDNALLDLVLKDIAQTSKTISGTETTPVSRIEPGQYVLFRLHPQTLRMADFKYSPQRDIFQSGTQAEQPLG